MAKEKSLKLRTILSFLALYKYSDKNHRLTSQRMNTFLCPFELKISGVGLSDDVKVLQAFGVDAHTNDGTQAHSAYIGEHIFSNDVLQKLVYAVSTNPNLSNSQASEILSKLKPLGTAYQEPLMQSFVNNSNENTDDLLYWNYLIFREAIETNRRILYSVDYPKYNGNTKAVDHLRAWETLFTPVKLLIFSGKLCVLGYNNDDRKVETLDLATLATTRLAAEFKEKQSLVTKQRKIVLQAEIMPELPRTVLYEGPATFRCSASIIPTLLHLFGEPLGPVRQAHNSRTLFSVEHAVVTTDVLSRLAALTVDNELHIIEPEPLRATAGEYFDKCSATILSAKFPRKRCGNG